MEKEFRTGITPDALKGTKIEQNLHTALSGESQAYIRYKLFESKAKKDGFVEISQIFCETAENAKELVGNLSDCFTVPGVVFLGIGGLTWVAHMGGFDSFGYIFSNFSLHNLWTTKAKKKYQSFYDYKQEKEEKGRPWLSHFAVLGAASLAVGILLLIVYLIL